MQLKSLLAATTILASTGFAGVEYDVIVLAPDATSSHFAYDISNFGFVAGYFYTTYPDSHAFRWDPANLIVDLGAPSATDAAHAYGVNNAGTLVGNYGSAPWSIQTACTYDDSGITVLSTDPGNYDADAVKINNWGVTVGTASAGNWPDDGEEEEPIRSGDFIGYRAYIHNGISIIYPPTLGGIYSSFSDVDMWGNAAGTAESNIGYEGDDPGTGEPPEWYYESHAVYWNGASLIDLGTFGGHNSSANGMNDLGQVVGESEDDPDFVNGTYGFFWEDLNQDGDTDAGEMIVVGPQTYGAQANDINNSSVIVGNSWFSNPSGGSSNLGWRADTNGNWELFNNLIDPASGWTIYSPKAINDYGQVICNAFHPRAGWKYVLLDPINGIDGQCFDAAEIFEGNTAFDTTDQPHTGWPHVDDCQFDGQTYHDKFYFHSATCNGILEVATCNQAGFDTDLVVYTGDDCGTLELLGCNDDALGCADFSSKVEVTVEQGQNIWIRVGGWQAGNMGQGVLTIECQCPNDYTGDGFIDLADFSLLLIHFGTFNDVVDPNGDGFTDIADFSLFLIDFGTNC